MTVLNLDHTQRILFYRIGQLGDTVVALPAMWAIRRYFPKAYMVLLSDCQSGSGYIGPQEVLPPQGLFDGYLFYESNPNGVSLRALWEIMTLLRRHRFDTLVYLAPRTRPQRKVLRDLFFFRLAGIRQFIGHRGFTLPARKPGKPLPFLEHESDHLLNRLAKSGISISGRDRGCMDLKLTQAELEEARLWLQKHNIGNVYKGPRVGFGPGSKWPSKVWPLEYFAALGSQLISEFDVFPIVFGGVDDRYRGEYLVSRWGRGSVAAGQLKVRQVSAVLSICQLYVGNDTGTIHLAAAVGVPCVVAFAAIDWPGRWYPYGNHHSVLRHPVHCEGCRSRVCLNHDMRCLKQVSVKDMLIACRKRLK